MPSVKYLQTREVYVNIFAMPALGGSEAPTKELFVHVGEVLLHSSPDSIRTLGVLAVSPTILVKKEHVQESGFVSPEQLIDAAAESSLLAEPYVNRRAHARNTRALQTRWRTVFEAQQIRKGDAPKARAAIWGERAVAMAEILRHTGRNVSLQRLSPRLLEVDAVASYISQTERFEPDDAAPDVESPASLGSDEIILQSVPQNADGRAFAIGALQALDLTERRPFIGLSTLSWLSHNSFVGQGERACRPASLLNAIIARGTCGLNAESANAVLEKLLTAPEYAPYRQNEPGLREDFWYLYPGPVALEVQRLTGKPVECTTIEDEDATPDRIYKLVNRGLIAAIGVGLGNGENYATIVQPDGYDGIAIIDPRSPQSQSFAGSPSALAEISRLQNGVRIATIF